MKALLVLLCALMLLGVLRAPPAWSPSSIALTLAPGESLVLGQRELAAPLADAAHLRVRRDAQGNWWLRNVSAGKNVLLQQGPDEWRTGTARLAKGDVFQVGGARFEVTYASPRQVAFTGIGHEWRYDGATLLRDGASQAACPGARLPVRLAALWNAVMPRVIERERPLVFGGNLNCENRLGVANTAPGSAAVRNVDGELLLAAGPGDGERMPLPLSAGDVPAADLSSREEALGQVEAIVAGRTRLALHIDGDRLLMSPQRHVALYAEPRISLPHQAAWNWRQRDAWVLPGGPAWMVAAALAGTLVLGAAVAMQRGHWPFVRHADPAIRLACAVACAIAITGVASLLLLRAGTPPGAGISVLLGCAALWCCMLAPGRLPLAMTAGLVLVAVGLLAQLELGLAAAESSMLRHFQKTVALLAIGLGAGTVVRLRMRTAHAFMPHLKLEYMLAALAVAALAALLLQVAFGDETGVFDIQPVDFAKLALTLLTAHCLAVGLGWQAAPDAGRGARWFRLGAPALLFLALMGFALVQVDDFSPLILLGVWLAAMVFAWSVACGRHVAAATVAGIALLSAAGIVLLRGADQLDQWGFYADRFAVWLDPARHPHTGQQVLLGARAIAEGAWWGSDRLLGIASLGLPGSGALLIPAVQDDFAPSFFLNRHGLLAGLALWLLQALFLAGLLHTAARAHAAGRAAR
ncbi:MAG: FtsW/RodA/SpoVE family cell cycle protein, partial [Telluria sp.]